MATTLTRANVDLTLSWLFQNTLDQTNAQYKHSYTFSDKLANGVLVDQAEMVFWDERPVSATTTDTIDLRSALKDAFGNSIILTRLKGLFIENTSTTVGAILHLKMPANDRAPLFGAAGDLMYINPGGVFFWYDPSYAAVAIVDGDATASVGDKLDIYNSSAASITYRIGIIGTTSA